MTSADDHSTTASEPKPAAAAPARAAAVYTPSLVAVVLAAVLAFYLGVRTGRRMEHAKTPTDASLIAAETAPIGDASGTAKPADGTVFRDAFRDLPVRPADPLKGLDDRIKAAMKEWDVPGVAVAIVKDDAVVYSKGFGVVKLGDAKPVDANTLFGIASTTKGFTTALAAMLVDEGKLGWEDSLARHLPDLELHEPLSVREVTLRDVLCHRVGLPRSDEIWAGTGRSREEVLKKLAQVRPKWPLRTQFAYNNALYLAAGEAIAHAGGGSWDDLVRTRIFEPLGMKASQASTLALVDAAGNVASGHDLVAGKLASIPAKNLDNCAPATGIVSNIADMAQWVRFQLASGVRGDKALIQPSTAYTLTDPQIVIPESDNLSKMYPDKTYSAYAMGWIVQDYRNRRVVQHPGNANGMRSLVALIPEERLGIVVLANRELSPLPMAIMYDIFDAYLGKQQPDRVAARSRAMKDFVDSRPLANRGLELLRAGKTADALASFDQAIRKDPLNALIYHSRGVARAATRNFDGAIADYSQALRLDPLTPKVLSDRALARINRGDQSGGLADATKALELDPDLAEAFNNRALALKGLDRLDEAVADASRAIELNPKLAGAYAIRGLAYLKQGKDELADKDFGECLKIQPAMKAPLDREATAIIEARSK